MSNAQLSQVLYVLVHTVTYINIFDTDTCTLYNTVVRLDHTYQYEYSEGKSRNPPVHTEFSKKKHVNQVKKLHTCKYEIEYTKKSKKGITFIHACISCSTFGLPCSVKGP